MLLNVVCQHVITIWTHRCIFACGVGWRSWKNLPSRFWAIDPPMLTPTAFISLTSKEPLSTSIIQDNAAASKRQGEVASKLSLHENDILVSFEPAFDSPGSRSSFLELNDLCTFFFYCRLTFQEHNTLLLRSWVSFLLISALFFWSGMWLHFNFLYQFFEILGGKTMDFKV